jgi:hypothetical protein
MLISLRAYRWPRGGLFLQPYRMRVRNPRSRESYYFRVLCPCQYLNKPLLPTGFEFRHQAFDLLTASPLPNANGSNVRHADSASNTRPVR